MGNRGCSCAPPPTKTQTPKPRSGHVLRLWAEVFHVSAASGAVRWTQVSDDLVPVNVACVATDASSTLFHITAYNSRVDKVLDVRLSQPGTRLGQASDCFVYWKDALLGDTWGLNFTSATDARAFRECCSGYKRTQSSYSLRDAKRDPKKRAQSQPSSPQCTCMTADALHRARNGRVRYTPRQDSGGSGSSVTRRAQFAVRNARSVDAAVPRPTARATQSRARSSDDVRTVATTTEDLQLDSHALKKMLNGFPDRSKNNRSMEGRRRSLERSQCVDLSDASPSRDKLTECERELRSALLKERDWDSLSVQTFEAILTQSMSDVATLMRQVEEELDQIRAEERLLARAHTLPTRAASLPSSLRRSALDALDASFDDSRVYVTSSEVSDDEKLSLTAISDDDEDMRHAFAATGAVRRAGFLNVKKWLLRKRHSLELARKRAWKGYWVTLKGTTLLFYDADANDAPKHLIFAEHALVQPVPEHPKREHVLCLSTAIGDAYLIQASSDADAEHWLNAIHCACAASFARARGRAGTLHALQEEVHRCERNAESDARRKHELELQMSLVTDATSPLHAHIVTVEESLDRTRVDQFRLRCYMASLSGAESPNPKTLLSHVSRRAKLALNRLGIFTVSSLHAFVAAKTPARAKSPKPRPQSACGGSDRHVTVIFPDGESTLVPVRDSDTAEDVLHAALRATRFASHEHFLRARFDDGREVTLARTDPINEFVDATELRVRVKSICQVELARASLDAMFGFSVEAELGDDDALHVHVSRVEDGSLAARNGVAVGDEIVVINGALIADVDMMFVESVLVEETTLQMMVRSSRASTDDLIESLVCPPPPINGVDAELSDAEIHQLIVPLPERNDDQKVLKVIAELMDTEASYGHDLQQLENEFLAPLRDAKILETDALNARDLIEQQKRFHASLMNAKDVHAIASTFIAHAQDFRAYATFCASHARVSKLLRESASVGEFLLSRARTQLELESLLIKPIQRVLKYPLLLAQMRAHDPTVVDAQKAIESVAEHINEMMRVQDEYGAIFEHLQRQATRATKMHVDLSASSLLHYGGVEWTNAVEFLGRARKGLELHAMCFVFCDGVVFLCKERMRHKKNRASDVEIIRHQTLIPVNEVQVKTARDAFAWELIHLKTASGRRSEKTYKLQNSTSELRNAFLKHVRHIIRQSVANMNLKSDTSVACAACGDRVELGARDSPVWKRRDDSDSRDSK